MRGVTCKFLYILHQFCKFQSTLPGRERRLTVKCSTTSTHFNPHSPCGERRARVRGRDTGDMRTAPNRGAVVVSSPHGGTVMAYRRRLPWATISGYHGTVTRDSARVSGDVWYNSGLPLSTRIDTLCMWHQSRIGARPSAQCGARHAPRRGREGGVRARRRADPLEAPVRGALCPARADTHEHPPTHPTGARQTSRQAAREGPHAEPHKTGVLINSAPARCAGANCAKQRPRFVGLGCAAGRARAAAAHVVGRLSPVQPRRGGANGQGRARRRERPSRAELFRDARL